MRGILSLSHFTGWPLSEIDALPIDEFLAFIAHARALATEK